MAHSAERMWSAVPVASSTDVRGKRDITTLNEAGRAREGHLLFCPSVHEVAGLFGPALSLK